jgi:hypothetical protein
MRVVFAQARILASLGVDIQDSGCRRESFSPDILPEDPIHDLILQLWETELFSKFVQGVLAKLLH